MLSSSVYVYDGVANSIKITPFDEVAYKPVITVQCTGVLRPRAGLLLSDIIISAYKLISGVEYLMASGQCGQQQLLPRQTLQVTSFTADNPYLLSAPVTYSFTITLSPYVSLQTTDLLYVYMPYQFSIPVGTLACTLTIPLDPSSATGSPLCQAASIGSSSTTTLIKISSFLQNSQVVGSSPTLQVSLSGITNPSSDPSSTAFIISLLTSS